MNLFFPWECLLRGGAIRGSDYCLWYRKTALYRLQDWKNCFSTPLFGFYSLQTKVSKMPNYSLWKKYDLPFFAASIMCVESLVCGKSCLHRVIPSHGIYDMIEF